MNRFYFMMRVVVISIWSNFAMGFCEQPEGFSLPQKEFATAKTFSEAIEMIKKSEADLYVSIITDQETTQDVKKITVRKVFIEKEPGYGFDVYENDSFKKTIIPGEDSIDAD